MKRVKWFLFLQLNALLSALAIGAGSEVLG